MGKITILDETSSHPIQLIGKVSGICYGSDITNEVKLYLKDGYRKHIDIIKNNFNILFNGKSRF